MWSIKSYGQKILRIECFDKQTTELWITEVFSWFFKGSPHGVVHVKTMMGNVLLFWTCGSGIIPKLYSSNISMAVYFNLYFKTSININETKISLE